MFRFLGWLDDPRYFVFRRKPRFNRKNRQIRRAGVCQNDVKTQAKWPGMGHLESVGSVGFPAFNVWSKQHE